MINKELTLLDRMELRVRCVEARRYYANHLLEGAMQSWLAVERRVRRIQELTGVNEKTILEEVYPFSEYRNDDGTWKVMFDSLRAAGIPIPTQVEVDAFYSQRGNLQALNKRLKKKLR